MSGETTHKINTRKLFNYSEKGSRYLLPIISAYQFGFFATASAATVGFLAQKAVHYSTDYYLSHKLTTSK